MSVRQLTAEQVERLTLLDKLPDDVVVPTRDAMLIACIGSQSTWQRLKALGKTPPVYQLNGSTDGFRNGDCKEMRARRRVA
jgi:hypothetical protein